MFCLTIPTGYEAMQQVDAPTIQTDNGMQVEGRSNPSIACIPLSLFHEIAFISRNSVAHTACQSSFVGVGTKKLIVSRQPIFY